MNEETSKFDMRRNLCSDCEDVPAECDSSPLFGKGPGNDNVVWCDGYFGPEVVMNKPDDDEVWRKHGAHD